MAELQEHESPQRRRSFDDVLKDALTQWTKRFERALEELEWCLERGARTFLAPLCRDRQCTIM